MDAETATFASRIRRVMGSKVEELQASSPGFDSGMLACILACSIHCLCRSYSLLIQCSRHTLQMQNLLSWIYMFRTTNAYTDESDMLWLLSTHC